MQRSFIFGLIIAILLVLFTVQNSQPIDSIYLWFKSVEIKSSVGVVLLITFAIGSLIGYLLSLSAVQKKNKQLRQKDKHIKNMNIALEEVKATKREYEKDYGIKGESDSSSVENKKEHKSRSFLRSHKEERKKQDKDHRREDDFGLE